MSKVPFTTGPLPDEKAARQAVIDAIDKVLGKPATAGTRLIADLGADSLDFVEILMEIEDSLDIVIPESEEDRFRKQPDVKVSEVAAVVSIIAAQGKKESS